MSKQLHDIKCEGCARVVGKSDRENARGYKCEDCGQQLERIIRIDPSANIPNGQWELRDGLLVNRAWDKERHDRLVRIDSDELAEIRKGIHLDRPIKRM